MRFPAAEYPVLVYPVLAVCLVVLIPLAISAGELSGADSGYGIRRVRSGDGGGDGNDH